MELLNENELPVGFLYPKEFLKIVDLNLVDITPWIVMEGNYLKSRFEGLKKRYPERVLVPFARRLDNDDLACWSENTKDAVFIIHDFAAQGWEQKQKYSDFWEWFRKAVDDMISHD